MAGDLERLPPISEIDQLGAYWDALLNGQPSGEGIDPTLSATVDRFQELIATPPPSPLFVARLREELLESPEPLRADRPLAFEPHASAANGRLVVSGARAAHQHRRNSSWHATAALVLLAFSLSAAILIPSAGRLQGVWGGLSIAVRDTAPPSLPAPTEPQILAQMRIPAGLLPVGTALLWMQVYELDPGAEGTYPGVPIHVRNLALFGVRTGTMAIGNARNGLSSDAPLEIFRNGPAAIQPAESDPNEIVLEAGDAVLLPLDPGSEYVIRNPGSEPLEFIEAVVYGAGERGGQKPPANFNLRRYAADRYIDIPVGAQPTLRLEQIPLAPDQRIPARDPATGAQLAVSLDGFFEQRADGSARNMTDALLNIYLFTVEVERQAAAPVP